FLSTFSLPADIKNRTIYTVVTKPVLLAELILGRILGFALIGTLILAVMCVLSYVFVLRGVSHTHQIDAKTLTVDRSLVDDTGEFGRSGLSTMDSNHRHTVHMNADGTGYTDVQKGHRHEVRRVGDNWETARYVVGPPVGQLEARMPEYGSLTFLDRAGRPTDKGINVGNEWTYRSYIEGGTLAAAIWSFDNIYAGRFPESRPEFAEGIPIDLTLRVFRSYKGEIERGILGSLRIIEYVDPADPEAAKRPPLISEPMNFFAEEFTSDRRYIPRKLKASRAGEPPQTFDLFEDFAHQGKLRVQIRCEDPAQYYGAAKPDVYIWTGDNYFALNFFKGYVSIWVQMLLVIAFGVTFSTFVSGPVAMLATVMSYVVGYFSQFVFDVMTGKQEGGGPLESLIRTVEQRNLVTKLDEGVGTSVVQGVDTVSMHIMTFFSKLMPSYSDLDTSSYVAKGYDIPVELISQHVITAIFYFLVLSMIGYFIFKSREVAA
ncbi:MAG: hypothetical protein KDA71_20390, partial [Planctomycetales bacterium]|nr:hypothetical protein [Planctomycetales bacterium]